MKNIATIVAILTLAFGHTRSFGQQQKYLDTLSTLTNNVEIASFILKNNKRLIGSTRDSLLTVATGLLRGTGRDTLLADAITAQGLLHWEREEFELFYKKIKEAHDIYIGVGDEKGKYSTLNHLAWYYQKINDFGAADSIFQECIFYWKTRNEYEPISKGYNNRAVVYTRLGDFEKADSLIQLAKEYAKKQGGARRMASAMTTEMAIASYSGNGPKSYTICKAILDTIAPIAEEDLNFYANTLHNTATIAAGLGSYEEAIEYYLEADSIFKKIDNTNAQIVIKNGLAGCYRTTGDYDLALNFYKMAAKLRKSQKNSLDLADIYHGISGTYLDLEESESLDKAKIYNDSAYQIFVENAVETRIGRCHQTYASIYQKMGEDEKALNHLNDALTIFLQSNNLYYASDCYFHKAKALHKLNRNEEAKLIFRKVDSNNLQTDRDLAMYYLVGGKILHKTADYAESADLLLQANILSDSISTAEQEIKFKEISDKYQAAEQLAVNARLETEKVTRELTISKQQSLLGYGGLGLGLASLLSFLLYRQGRKRALLNEELEKQKNQVVLLNQELNHRVKNNLAFMTSLLEMQGRRSVHDETKQALQESETRLKALSLVHSNLFKTESETKINLREYLTEITDHLKDIFELPTKELVVRRSFVDTVMDAEEAMRIGLIVNELVTNSVKHAFAQVDNPTINIETIENAGKLVLRYKDNGPGIKITEVERDPRRQSLGVKLINLLQKQVADAVSLEVG